MEKRVAVFLVLETSSLWHLIFSDLIFKTSPIWHKRHQVANPIGLTIKWAYRKHGGALFHIILFTRSVPMTGLLGWRPRYLFYSSEPVLPAVVYIPSVWPFVCSNPNLGNLLAPLPTILLTSAGLLFDSLIFILTKYTDTDSPWLRSWISPFFFIQTWEVKLLLT